MGNKLVEDMYIKTRANILSNIELCKKTGEDASESERCLKQLEENYKAFRGEEYD